MPETPQANLPEKTTYYKGEDQVSMTPEEAIKFQGGSSDNPFGGLERSGWSTKAPTPPAPITPVVEAKTETPKTPEQLDKETKDTEMKSASDNVKQQMTDQIAYLTSNLEKQAKEFENYTADIARIDAENDPMIQNIKDIFARRIATMESTNKAMQGQVALAGSRSGLKRYASQMHQGLVSAETTAGMNRISELESQKLTAIQEAKRALKSDAKDKWKTFNEFMDSATKAYGQKVQAVKDLHTFLKDEEDRAYNQKIADINLQQVIREGQQATAESIAGSLYTQLGDDIEGSMQFIIDKAKEYDIDPDVLVSSMQQYARDDFDNTLEIQKKLLDMGTKITEGEQVEVYPGIIVKGTKKRDEMWIESIVGNTKYKDLYVKEGGEYVKKQRVDMGQAYKPTGTPSGDANKMWTVADSLRKDLASGAITWGQAWNRVKAQFPNVSNKDIDDALGGSGGFDEKTGTFNEELATGFAQPGERIKKQEYFAKPDNSGTIKYYYGNPNSIGSVQEISSTEYYKGTSKSADALSDEGSFADQIVNFMTQAKETGYSEKAIKKMLKSEYGEIPSSAEDWLNENF